MDIDEAPPAAAEGQINKYLVKKTSDLGCLLIFMLF